MFLFVFFFLSHCGGSQLLEEEWSVIWGRQGVICQGSLSSQTLWFFGFHGGHSACDPPTLKDPVHMVYVISEKGRMSHYLFAIVWKALRIAFLNFHLIIPQPFILKKIKFMEKIKWFCEHLYTLDPPVSTLLTFALPFFLSYSLSPTHTTHTYTSPLSLCLPFSLFFKWTFESKLQTWWYFTTEYLSLYL